MVGATRRGRGKTVCARGARWALLGGPSTSPLEAMTISAAVIVGAFVLVIGLAWVLVPPFPSPETLINSSLTALTGRFGPPHDLPPETPAPLRSAKSVAWTRSRVVAVWMLQADWNKAPPNPVAHPDMVSRCLRVSWAPDWLGAFLPCKAVVIGQVMASNNRWRGP